MDKAVTAAILMSDTSPSAALPSPLLEASRRGGGGGAATAVGVDMKRLRARRTLWLEVVWQQASSEACKPFDLKPGDIIERRVAQLEQFEVYRSRWREETRRLPLIEEMRLLSNCFNPLHAFERMDGAYTATGSATGSARRDQGKLG